MEERCLFTAPSDLLGEIGERYRRLVPTLFREAWTVDELPADERFTAWVVNPGQHFIVNSEVLQRYPHLRVLATPSTGQNHLDLAECARRGITCLSLLSDRGALEGISASAEFTFLLLLNALRRIDRAVHEVTEGRWRRNEGMLRGRQLQGKRIGLVGFGRIGRRLARYGTAFGAQLAYYDPYVNTPEFESWPLKRLFSQMDVVVLCCRLTPETRGMIGRSLLNCLKPGACLVNTSRGEVIREADLAEVLKERPDLSVALDVLSGEAVDAHRASPLLGLHREGRIVITPHIAGATWESQRRAAEVVLDLLESYFHANQEVAR